MAARQSQRAAGKKPRGPESKPPSEGTDPKAQDNFTDPESRIMKAGNGQPFEPPDNAPAAVKEGRWIVGQRVSDAPNDKPELVATVAAISPGVAGDVPAGLVDSGFYSAASVQAVEQKPDGTPSGLTVFAAVWKQSHHKTVADLLPQPEPAPLSAPGARRGWARTVTSGASERSSRGLASSNRCWACGSFFLRGREKVSLEWLLVCVSDNFKRRFTLKSLTPTG